MTSLPTRRTNKKDIFFTKYNTITWRYFRQKATAPAQWGRRASNAGFLKFSCSPEIPKQNKN